jgi:hypothetical protein
VLALLFTFCCSLLVPVKRPDFLCCPRCLISSPRLASSFHAQPMRVAVPPPPPACFCVDLVPVLDFSAQPFYPSRSTPVARISLAARSPSLCGTFYPSRSSLVARISLAARSPSLRGRNFSWLLSTLPLCLSFLHNKNQARLRVFTCVLL